MNIRHSNCTVCAQTISPWKVISKLQVKLFTLKTASNKLKYRFIVVFQFHSFLVLTGAELNQELLMFFFSFLEQSRFSMNSKIKCKQNVCWAASMRGGVQSWFGCMDLKNNLSKDQNKIFLFIEKDRIDRFPVFYDFNFKI